jgi:hypothetical protein
MSSARIHYEAMMGGNERPREADGEIYEESQSGWPKLFPNANVYGLGVIQS